MTGEMLMLVVMMHGRPNSSGLNDFLSRTADTKVSKMSGPL
jgi:hypothetical protein